jgi:hypothetical protein
MKTHRMKSVAIAAVLSVAVVAGFTPAHAQEIATSGTTPANDSLVAIAADSQSLPQVAPSNTPVRGGTFWWVYPGGLAIPMPMLPLGPSGAIYSIAPDEYLVDLTGGTVMVTPYQLRQEAQVSTSPYAAAVTAQVQGLVNIITMVQTPVATTTTSALAMKASPMDGGGGFSPMGQTQSGVPYLTIAPTNGVFLLTVYNDIGPTNYEIWTTPVLTDPSWTLVTNGLPGQTNFAVNMGPFETEFYRALMDTNTIPVWELADPNNPSEGILTVFIDSPTNGAVIQ